MHQVLTYPEHCHGLYNIQESGSFQRLSLPGTLLWSQSELVAGSSSILEATLVVPWFGLFVEPKFLQHLFQKQHFGASIFCYPYFPPNIDVSIQYSLYCLV